MSVTYKNPPLVEIVSELRWGPPSHEAQEQDRQIFRLRLPQVKDEEVFMHFAAIAAANGYARLERLMPPGMPFPPSQAACRFRPTDPAKQSPLFQLGAGVFTANAVPPYRSWDSFLPDVCKGIDALFESYGRAGLEPPKINTALVRYIDAFRDDLTGGVEPSEFIRDVLGLRVELPAPVSKLATNPSKILVSTQIETPIEVGIMTISIGSGFRDSERAVMLDTTVLINRDIGPDAEGAVAALSEARGVIHNLFETMTSKIRTAMKPEG